LPRLSNEKRDQVTQVRNLHEKLIEGCRKNNRDAQFKVYKLYYKAMYNTALRILNDTAEAEDVMQEAFLDAFNKISSFRGESSFGAWLKRIVINRSLDVLKQQKDFMSLDEAGEEIADNFENENYLEILSYKVDLIRRAIHMLPDNYRIILSLYLLEGYDHEEISQILEVSNNVSRTRFSRAKAKLIELIRDENESFQALNA
jgi:RNA polymerase sigma-70 factor (ECF subfamily)